MERDLQSTCDAFRDSSVCVCIRPVTVVDMDGVDVEACSDSQRNQRGRIGSARQGAGDRCRGRREDAASEELTGQLCGIGAQRS